MNVAILEPCTGYPVGVGEGIMNGTHRVLGPMVSVETEVAAVVYEGLTGVTSIDRDGNVAGES